MYQCHSVKAASKLYLHALVLRLQPSASGPRSDITAVLAHCTYMNRQLHHFWPQDLGVVSKYPGPQTCRSLLHSPASIRSHCLLARMPPTKTGCSETVCSKAVRGKAPVRRRVAPLGLSAKLDVRCAVVHCARPAWLHSLCICFHLRCCRWGC